MKWFKHESNARNDVKIKILMQRHGIEGYGVYFIMLELIAEYATEKNVPEWGFVDKIHKKLTLSAETHTSVEKLEEILKTCNELDLFQDKNHRLYCRQILDRLDEYATKVKRKREKRTGEKELVGTLSGQSPVREEKKREDQNRILLAGNRQELSKEEFEKEMDEIILLLEKKLDTNITNRGKQQKALRMILDAGYTINQTKKCIVFMADKDDYWEGKGFDLMTVANQLPKYKAETRKAREVTA